MATPASACDQPNALSSPVNVAEYQYNPVTGLWHLTSSWYDPAIEYYVPDPDDYTFQVGGPGDPAYPGGGGGVNPPSQPYSGDVAFGGNGTGIQLCDVITVIGTPIHGLLVSGWPKFRRLFKSSGSGSHSRVAAGIIPPSPLNEDRADCTDDQTSRGFSALTDLNHFCAASPGRCSSGGVPRQPMVRTVYNNGASEMWRTAPYTSLKLHDTPVEGSMLGCD